MDYFTDAYDKSRELLEAPCFAASWGAIERQVKALLGPDGPSDTEAKVLSDIPPPTSAMPIAASDRAAPSR